MDVITEESYARQLMNLNKVAYSAGVSVEAMRKILEDQLRKLEYFKGDKE